MTKRIFRSIFLVALTVLLAALVLVMGALNSYFTGVQLNQLRIETALAAHAVSNQGLSYFDRMDDTAQWRITWIDSDGTVLFDSRSNRDAMENHLAREEVQQALEFGYGQSSRYSNTLMERYIYAAELLDDGTVLRLSTAQSSVLNLVLDIFWYIAAIVAAAIILSYLLARRLSQDIVQPLNTLDLDNPLSSQEYEEIAPLLRRLDSQQRQLQAQSQELKLKQREFTAVTRSLSEGLVLINSSGTVLSINPAAKRLLEVTQECLGTDFTAANRNEAIAALVAKALSGEKSEQTVTLSAGEYLAAASPVKTDGAVSGVVLLLFDVTQKRQAEMLRKEFTANVSHELKTPLHAISGYAELMQSGIVPEKDMRSFSEKIYSEAQRMARLVEDTLRLSRLDEGAADMQWAPVELYETVQSILRELAAPAELAGVTLRLEGRSAALHGIPQLVSAIAFNLTDNAIKYNHPGGSVLVKVEDGQREVVLTVSDTGLGIPEEHRERIFERFYRVDKSHSKEVGGTGLGLSIVKHAALILGAGIQLDSTVGKGTTVTVRFPKSVDVM